MKIKKLIIAVYLAVSFSTVGLTAADLQEQEAEVVESSGESEEVPNIPAQPSIEEEQSQESESKVVQGSELESSAGEVEQPVVQQEIKEEEQPVKSESSKKKAKKVAAPVKESVAGNEAEDIFVVDRIESIVFGPEDTDIITLSDVQRSSIDGAPRTINDIKLEKLVYQDAKKYRIIPDEDAIDKYLASVQKQHNITLEQLKDVFRGAGYSYEEGREQFGVMYTVNSMLEFKIRSRLVVPEREIEAYYKAHPEFEEPAYQISRAFIPFTRKGDRDELRVAVEEFAATGKGEGLKGVEWGEPFWIKESEVSEEKQFIAALKPGAIAQPIETEQGFELIKLKAKRGRRERSLEDRYREIADILRKPKYDELMRDYKTELFTQSAIVDF